MLSSELMREAFERFSSEVRPLIEDETQLGFMRGLLRDVGRDRARLGEALEGKIKECKGCGMQTRRKFDPVQPRGDRGAYFVVVGRNPGRIEMENGTPFHPKAPGGGYLDNYLNILGVGRTGVYVTNAFFCWASGPLLDEAETRKCATRFKSMELGLLERPKFVFLLGNSAVRAVVDSGAPSILKNYGKYFVARGGKVLRGTVFLFPVMHPGSVMRERKLMDVVGDQLLEIKKKFVIPFLTFLEGDPSVEEVREWEV